MTKIKTLSAVIIFSTAIATPVLAQDPSVTQSSPTRHVRSHASNYRGSYNQVNQPAHDPFGFDKEQYPRLLYSGN
jgi:hypothetical protein